MSVVNRGHASITTLQIDFQRTLRIPDDGKIYPLPAGFGRFPLRHVDDYKDTLPAPWIERGGVLMPMYQSEALWIRFSTRYPFAVKVAAGKINAVTGDPWSRDLQADPQNYLVLPEQPWLDGFAVRKGVIRQFVAMPLGGEIVELADKKAAEEHGRTPRRHRVLHAHRTRPCSGVTALASTDQ